MCCLAGADVTIVNSNGDTAMHFAAFRGDTEIVQSMLEHGAFVDAQAAKGSTALHLAVGLSQKSTMLLLLKTGAKQVHWCLEQLV